MSTQWLQTLLVTVIVSTSAVLAVRHVAPGPFRLCQATVARVLGQSRHSAILRTVGRWLQPLEARQGGCGGGLGCSSCGGCGTSSATKAVESIPLKVPSPPRQRH